MKKQVFLFCIVALLFATGCKKETTYSLNKESIILTSKGTFQLTVQGGAGNFTYTSDNPLVAEVDAGGQITGKRVGQTSIKVSGDFNGTCIVAISPLYFTFVEPITEFGLSKNQIKAKETRTYGSETNDGVLFMGSINEKYVLYLFENDKMTSSGVVLSSTYSSALGSYMAERYVLASADPFIAYSITKSFCVYPVLQTSLEWYVFYLPYTLKSVSLNTNLKYRELISKI